MTIAARAIQDGGNLERSLRARGNLRRFLDRWISPRRPLELGHDEKTGHDEYQPFQYFQHFHTCRARLLRSCQTKSATTRFLRLARRCYWSGSALLKADCTFRYRPHKFNTIASLFCFVRFRFDKFFDALADYLVVLVRKDALEDRLGESPVPAYPGHRPVADF